MNRIDQYYGVIFLCCCLRDSIGSIRTGVIPLLVIVRLGETSDQTMQPISLFGTERMRFCSAAHTHVVIALGKRIYCLSCFNSYVDIPCAAQSYSESC